MVDTRNIEQEFYSRYNWCLNPALTLKDLLHCLEEEISRFETLTGWQRDESKANLYLFVCAIACTADDYFGLRWINLSPLNIRLPKYRALIAGTQFVLDLLWSFVNFQNIGAWRWRRRWDTCVAQVCRVLVCDEMSQRRTLQELKHTVFGISSRPLPRSLLKRRMRLPEAFRSQDMAHHDVVKLIEQFCSAYPMSGRPTVVMGLRSAGAYFAPLMAEYLKSRNWSDVTWFSIRPKNGTTRWEEKQLRNAAASNAYVLVVDDYPSTGHTFTITFQTLRRFKIRPEQIAVLAPTHPAQPNWVQLAAIEPGIPVFTLQTSELYKSVALTSDNVIALCREYYAPAGWTEAHIVNDPSINETNKRLADHAKDGHHVREKRVFAIELSAAGRDPLRTNVFFKSVGWGWLGYHAYVAGKRLEDFVPTVLGLRNGMLVAEWVKTEATKQELSRAETMVPVIASYVAARSRRLPLMGDCRLGSQTYRWTGSDQILDILRAAYGPYINRMKLPTLRKQLFKYVTALPTLTDGRMRSEEWLHAAGRIYKGDFEHHNFGGGELDIVDPAYDLAATVFEFDLGADDERKLLERYRNESGDTSITERILLHKLLYGTTVMRYSMDRIALDKEPEKNNARCQSARDFLVYSMSEFCGEVLAAPRPARWSDKLFFMDLDGVFDQELLGFPHATQRGLESLSLLQSRGFSVVVNTGRSVQHVRQYCEAYGLPGGVAEFGSVFVDAVRRREVPLIDRKGAEQLRQCREAIRELEGVFVDPGYEYAIRAYRYRGRGTVGLNVEEVKTLLKRSEFRALTYIRRGWDSYIVQKHTSKGLALRFVRQELGKAAVPATAIGDSEYDVGMLKSVKFAYAPANCAPIVRELAKQGHCHIVKQRFQNGLLAAVRHSLQRDGKPLDRDAFTPRQMLAGINPLMRTVLKAADRRLVLQILAVLAWWSL
jgi:hydroxymethylpyrimidine pyrophosphatase-like HAD family hydrolase/adenine/guanine phosphoribosyltransferase-like PRPP-binding protein